MNATELFNTTWPYLVTLATFCVILATAVHILLKKRNTRAAAGWLGLVWAPAFIEQIFGSDDKSGLVQLSKMTEKLTRQPLIQGNRVTPLVNGDQAFPRMLSCITEAQHSITFCSYIFDNDSWGSRFKVALKDAKERGLEVKVLIDGVGARYSFRPMTRRLRREGLDAAEFMRTILPWHFQYFNLRNHRKILVIDGRVGFTGGMNIRDGNCLADDPSHPVQDIHFFIEGPVVAELQRSFAEDWSFTTREILEGEKWYPHLITQGDGVKLRMVILAALAAAQESIRIVTPYFLPDAELVSALRIAALRGLEVEILLPASSNLRMVKWASDAGLEELLRQGCRIFLTQPPFDHSKIMVVDHSWVLLGSANWDSRSLALNFEFNMECYDFQLEKVETIMQEKKSTASELTLEEVLSRNILVKLRNRFFRLFSPYL
jgi:cardiolipin synthase